MSTLNEQQRQQFRRRLTDRARSLEGEVSDIDTGRVDALATARDTVEDAGDAAEARRDDEVRSAEAERDAVELREVQAALVRLDDGSYGECIECGIEIPTARLDARPSAARCVACQERFEKEGSPIA